MTKRRTQYTCQQCGRITAKSLGRCPQCGAWNSMVADVILPTRGGVQTAGAAKPVRMVEVEGQSEQRVPLAISEFSRVLGGGVVPGSVVLIGGDPGIGKSTLLMQVAMSMAQESPVLYVSGEESAQQLKSRAVRIGEDRRLPEQLYLFTETDVDAILLAIQEVGPQAVVVDSIQTVQTAEIPSAAGSITQVREAAHRFQTMAKSSGVAVFLVGHVTKEGAIAGPRVLEHIVDTVLYLEGDRFHAYRLLRSVKNRFGATSEVGVFEMRSTGMVEVHNPSQIFLAERVTQAPGSAIAVTMEGTRPMLAEVQGLTSVTSFGHPRRTANGIDFNRLLLTIAVLSRRVGLKLVDQDVFVNVVGGLRVSEPAIDLAVAAAIASSLKDCPIPSDYAFIGEVGLSGELRAVARLPERLREAAKLGFRKVIVPIKVAHDLAVPEGIEVVPVGSLRESLKIVLQAG